MEARADTCSPYSIRRGDVVGHAASLYIPRVAGRLAAHHLDGFSAGLWLAQRDPRLGDAWMFDYARMVAPLVPSDTSLIVTPPSWLRRDEARGRFVSALGRAVAQILALPHTEPWLTAPGSRCDPGQLGSPFICHRDFNGERVCIVDDLVVSGATLARCGRALLAARAARPVPAAALALRETPRRPRRSAASARSATQGQRLQPAAA